MTHEHYLIKFNFSLGLRHSEILLSSCTLDGIVISTPTVRRILKCMGVYRRNSLTLKVICLHCTNSAYHFVCIDSSSYHNT